MRTFWRTIDRALVRDVAAVAAAVAFVGVSFGAIAVSAGLPTWAVVAMSVLIFAGGSQFMAVALVVAGSPVAAILGGLLLTPAICRSVSHWPTFSPVNGADASSGHI